MNKKSSPQDFFSPQRKETFVTFGKVSFKSLETFEPQKVWKKVWKKIWKLFFKKLQKIDQNHFGNFGNF
jgi:hypothetical protein